MQYIIRFIGGTGFFGKSILSMLNRGFGPALKITVLFCDSERFLTNHPEFLELSHSLSEGRGARLRLDQSNTFFAFILAFF